MNIVEMYDLCKEIYKANQDDHNFIGLRFEDKERQIGDVCEYSRDNPEREDERDFPEYGTEAYEEMEMLRGTSAWSMADHKTFKIDSWQDKERDCREHFLPNHCYVVVGRYGSCGLDDGEIVIEDAIVITQIF